MEDIKKRAETYKNKNGNSNITNKDLLFYIIARLDELEKSNKERDKEMEGIKTQIRIFWILLPIGLTTCSLVVKLVL
jgi:hypothetical protein